jgi:hypothetical protein
VRAADWGPLVVETDVDHALISTLRLWFPTYLSRLEEERGWEYGLFARPHPRDGYDNALEDDTFPDARLPAVIVTTARMTAFEEDGDGNGYASFRAMVSTISRGKTPRETREVASLLGGTAKRILLDKPDLGGFAGDLKLVSGLLAPVKDRSDKGRYLAASMSEVTVYVDSVLARGGGPIEAAPYEPPAPGDPAYDPSVPYDPPVTVREGGVTIDTAIKQP